MDVNSTPKALVTKKKIGKKRAVRIGLFVVALLLIAGGVFAWKTGFVLNKISSGNANIFKSLIKSLPGMDQRLTGEQDGRINVLLLGMRGEGVAGGGLLADTIMVLSIHPKQDDQDTARASLISIPRDLYVKVPGREEHRKINAVFALGEERELHRGGIDDMRSVVGEITGLDIPYAITINFQGFKDLINAFGGLKITLDQPFSEALQFREPQVCDSYTFTKPALNEQGQQIYECKYTKKPRSGILSPPTTDPYPLCKNKPADTSRVYRVTAQYPLCNNKSEECGGDFRLEAGTHTLDGDKALCYARSRVTSNDFERAKRQQQVIQALKDQAFSAGTLADFDAINGVLDTLGNNVRTNFEAWEMKRFFDLYQKIGQEAKIVQKVLDTSEEGLLYNPQNAAPEAGYILLPQGDNYDRIRALFQNSLNP